MGDPALLAPRGVPAPRALFVHAHGEGEGSAGGWRCQGLLAKFLHLCCILQGDPARSRVNI